MIKLKLKSKPFDGTIHTQRDLPISPSSRTDPIGSPIEPLLKNSDHTETCQPKIHITIRPDYLPKSESVPDPDKISKIQIKIKDIKNIIPVQKIENHLPLFSTQKRDIFCIKTSLKSIIRNPEVHQELNQIVINCHLLMTRAYEFVRLYLLKKYQEINRELDLKIITQPPPTMFPINPRTQKKSSTDQEISDSPEAFDAEIFKYFIKACARCSTAGSKPAFTQLHHELSVFYQQEFQPCLVNQQMYDRTHMSHLIDDMAVQMKTCFTVMIKNHFLTRFRRLMNILKPEAELDKKMFGKMKNQILKNKASKIDPKYSEWVRQVMSCLPILKIGNYGYDCKIHPENYLFYQIKINQLIEQYNQTHATQHKLYQPIPMRTAWIPCYTSISTDSIAESIPSAHSYLNKGNQSHRQQIWNCLFDMNRKIFKHKGYEIKSFQTNGISVSLCFSKLGRRRGQKTNSTQIDTDVYVDNLTPEELSIAKHRVLIGDDPGKQSPAYLMNQYREKVRYSTTERRLRAGYVLQEHVLLQEKNRSPSVLEAELELSKQTYKTIDYDRFKACIHLRDRLSSVMMDFYQRELFRKMNWRVWLRQRQFEDRFLNHVERTYGSAQELLICCGNWGIPYQMKHLYPSQGIGMRKLLRRRFSVVLVDEFRSSKLCNQCHHELHEHCGEYRLVLCPECQKCNSLTNKQPYIFHRDANGAMNILNLAQSMIHENTRPPCFCRQKHVAQSVSGHPETEESPDDYGTNPESVVVSGGEMSIIMSK